MADFYQNGIVTTLHNLSDRPIEDVEKELLKFSKTTYGAYPTLPLFRA